jgi:heptosyltransferase-2
MHVLITRFSSLGDVVIQTGFVNALKATYPRVTISFLTLKPFASLLENHNSIDNVYGYEKKSGLEDVSGLKKITLEIEKKNKIDFIIDLHGTTRSFLFKLLNPSTPAINIDKRRLERFLTINLKTDLLKKSLSHQKRAANDLRGLLGLDLSLSKTSLFVKDSTAEGQASKYIVFAPIASFEPKRWPIQSYQKLIDLILEDNAFKEYDLKIVAGPDDHYVEAISSSTRVQNLKGQTNLKESAALIKGASLVIGNDTGMGHIAEAFNIPSVVLFGPTHKSLGFSPYLDRSLSLSENLWCSPCSGTGKKKCFRKEQYCFTQLTPQKVFSEIKGITL